MDPRIVIVQIPAAEAKGLSCKIYQLAKNPFTFQDAVVVGTRRKLFTANANSRSMSAPRNI